MIRYSKRHIKDLLKASDTALTSDEKGKLLEDLISYMFEKIPSVELIDRNFMDGDRSQEIDLAFNNPQGMSPLNFLEAILFVECKNNSNPLSSEDVRWFIDKIYDRGSNYGILVVLNGITGNSNDNNSAHSQILRGLQSHKIHILVVTREEILRLYSTEDFVKLLREKFIHLKLYRTIC